MTKVIIDGEEWIIADDGPQEPRYNERGSIALQEAQAERSQRMAKNEQYISKLALENSATFSDHLPAGAFKHMKPRRTAEGFMWVFECEGVWADIEFFNSGEVFVGMTNFKDKSEVFEVQLLHAGITAAYQRLIDFLAEECRKAKKE